MFAIIKARKRERRLKKTDNQSSFEKLLEKTILKYLKDNGFDVIAYSTDTNLKNYSDLALSKIAKEVINWFSVIQTKEWKEDFAYAVQNAENEEDLIDNIWHLVDEYCNIDYDSLKAYYELEMMEQGATEVEFKEFNKQVDQYAKLVEQAKEFMFEIIAAEPLVEQKIKFYEQR
jgi:hypothetical protein